MKLKLTGRFLNVFDYKQGAEIEIDINDLYKQLKEYGFEILGWNDSRRKTKLTKKKFKKSIQLIKNS